MSFLQFTAQTPCVPGLFLRSDNTLLIVSVETQFDGSKRVWARDVTPNWVPSKPHTPVKFLLQPEPQGGETVSFLGPIKLPDGPLSDELTRIVPQLPTNPGLFWMSRNLGHTWMNTLVSVSIHRFTSRIRVAGTDELFGFTLPGLEDVSVETDRSCLFTLALQRPEDLDVSRLVCARSAPTGAGAVPSGSQQGVTAGPGVPSGQQGVTGQEGVTTGPGVTISSQVPRH